MANQQMWVVWIDANGQQSVRSITTNTGAAALLVQLVAQSNAVPKSTAEGDLVVPGGIPATTPYLSASQVAYLTFTDGANHNTTLALPSPSTSIFQADGTTVNALAIAGIIAAATGVLLTGAGTPITTFVSGQLGPGRVNS